MVYLYIYAIHIIMIYDYIQSNNIFIYVYTKYRWNRLRLNIGYPKIIIYRFNDFWYVIYYNIAYYTYIYNIF